MSALDKHLTHATYSKPPEPIETTPSLPVLDEAARKDNLRRLKYPVFVTEHEDGTRSFVHDPGVIRDGLISSTAADRGAHEAIPRGSDGSGAGTKPSTGPIRDEHGRFAKGGRDRA